MKILLLLLLSIESLNAATIINNGADDISPESRSVWFLGSREVSYCLEHGSSSIRPIPGKMVQEHFERAVQIWKKYLDGKQAHGFVLPRPISFNFKLKPQCDESTALKIYFSAGTTMQVLDIVRSKYINPVAIAHRLQFDPNVGWSRGFIWLQEYDLIDGDYPSWGVLDNPATSNLTGAFLHEIGHMLGISHVEGTIMDENIAKLFIAQHKKLDHAFYEKKLTTIDQTRELIVCLDCPLKISGEVQNLAYWQQTFSLPSMPLEVEYEQKGNVGRLTFTGNSLGVTIASKLFESPFPDTTVFKIAHQGKVTNNQVKSYGFSGEMSVGKKKYPIIINRNTGSVIEISVLVEGKHVKFFEANY